MRSASVRGLILGFVLVAGCKPDPHRPDAAPPWWKPAPGEATDWDIQIAASPFDVSMPRAMYTLYLWDVVPAATTIDYGDGAPLAVPAGVHPGAIADLHARTPPAIIVCQVGVGSIRLNDPDAKKFPGYEMSPPNRTTSPAAGSVIGWSTTATDANERFLDIHQAARTTITPLIEKRIDLAQAIGCDAVAAADSDVPAYQGDGQPIVHGFTDITFPEYESWLEVLASKAHELRLSIGSRNRSPLGVDQQALTHDWIIEARCAENEDCDLFKPFLNKSKAVFALEYDKTEAGVALNPTTLCGRLTTDGIKDGIVKDNALSSAVYMHCP
jgi:hypothetical protein